MKKILLLAFAGILFAASGYASTGGHTKVALIAEACTTNRFVVGCRTTSKVQHRWIASTWTNDQFHAVSVKPGSLMAQTFGADHPEKSPRPAML